VSERARPSTGKVAARWRRNGEFLPLVEQAGSCHSSPPKIRNAVQRVCA